MPSKRRKIQVILNDEEYDMVTRWAAVTGSSRSGVIRDLLVEAAPSFNKVIDAVQLAQEAPKRALSAMREALSFSAESMSQVDLDMAEAEEQMEMKLKEGIRGRRSRKPKP